MADGLDAEKRRPAGWPAVGAGSGVAALAATWGEMRPGAGRPAKVVKVGHTSPHAVPGTLRTRTVLGWQPVPIDWSG